APVFVGFLIAFPLLYQGIYTAIVGVDKDLVEMAKFYKVKSRDIVFGLYAPEIAPQVFDVSKSTLSLTLKVIIASEVLTYAKDSIGIEMQKANQAFDVAVLLGWTLVAILLAFILEGIVAGFKKLWEVRK
ncbi:MAG: ABC transporter permease subunit, partial [Clostridia bacterium]|nr:ABC transporter permease subunit [Clostridia bacterium]